VIGIIGSSGVTGTALAEALSVEGRPVRLIEHSPSLTDRWISADVRDVSALSAAVAGCTMLYHLARAHRTTFGRSSVSGRQCDGGCACVRRGRNAWDRAHRVRQLGRG
jgi:nucleoside-diphosphate-sugar epimerase